MLPNVVLLTIDSLRADHLGCYGYHKPTSPHLDALAREGTLFEKVFAPGIPTMPSFTTLHTGLHPFRHGITAHASSQRLAPDVKMAAQRFKELGYVTAAIDNLATQAHGRGSWFSRGFDYYSSFLYTPFSDQSAQLSGRAESYFEQLKGRPFFLWLHLWDPHTPYAPPPPYDTLHYVPGESGKSLKAATALSPEYYDAFLGDMKLKVGDDYDFVVAQYDGEISTVDAQVGRLMETLKSLGLYDTSHILALGDHGEAFGEGGIEFDHHGLYDAVTRIPLIWKRAGARVDASTCSALISNEDILPTMLEVCSADLQSEGEMTGRSFASALRGEEFAGREQIVCVESTRQCSIALRTRDWKLIVPIAQTGDGRRLPDLHGHARDEEPLLFDLKYDPREQKNLARELPEQLEGMMQVLASWRETEVARRGGDDPLEYGLSLPFDDFMKRLTGRGLRG